MEAKPISPRLRGLIDYALVGGLLTLPTRIKLNPSVKIYTAEALALLVCVALTDHPEAIKTTHPFSCKRKSRPV